MKRFLALLLCAILLLSMFPVSAAAKSGPEDLWKQITELEDRAAAVRGATTVESRAAAYSGVVDRIIELVENSANFVPDSIIRHGDFFYWDEADGTACGYSPRLRAQIREGADPNADPEAYAGVETVSYSDKGGWPSSTSVAAFQPYIGIDSSFTAQYETRCNTLAQALGGTGTTYKTNNATIDNIANAIQTCGVVIFDSHGDTDYASGSDYTSRANTSYICLQNGDGITAEDQVYVTGPYGQYRHAYYGGSYGSMKYYMVDGTAISNHMTGTSPNGLLWMAICLGMATDGMHAPLRAKGLEVCYGYSQSVTFSGDYAWEGKFWPKMIAGDEVKDAIAYMKQMVGCPDPYTGSYPAYPIVVSDEDVYPGHGNVDAQQTVNSTWTLYSQFNITALSNNEEWGTVSVSGRKITASPATGYAVTGYEVLEGTATVTQNGNVFEVNAESDCTIRINFAAREPAAIQFVVPEGVSVENFSGYVGDSCVLPKPTGNPTANAHNYAFLGWVQTEVPEDVTEVPSFQKAGTVLTVTEPTAVYYALYSYFIADDGYSEGEFTLVTAAPANWAGEYVITYQGQKVLDASGETTGVGICTAVQDLSAIGAVLEGSTLSNVPDEYIYCFEEAGSGLYALKMKEADCWLALTSDNNTMMTADNSSDTNASWSLSMGTDGVKIASAAYPTRSIRYNSKAAAFRCYKTGQQPVALYAAAQGTKYYTTNPKNQTACDEHVFGDWTTVTEPTCTEPGLQKRVCTVCGYTETEAIDPLGHDLIAHEAQEPSCTEVGWAAYETCSRCDYSTYEEIPALGHDYAAVVTEPTCTEGGYTTYTCSRCGDTYVGDETDALGHDYAAVVTEPSCTEGGYTTYTCSRCGDVYVGDETDPLGHDFGDWTVTAPPSCSAPGTESRTCARCGFMEEREIQPLEHDWYDYEWDWNYDESDEDLVVVHLRCHNCDETRTIWADVASQYIEPTCTEPGGYAKVATAVYMGRTFTDIRILDPIPALGHSWGEPEWTWNEDYDEAEAKFTCTVCGEVQTLPAELTIQTIMPDCVTPGEIKTTASVLFEEVTYTDVYTLVMAPLGHDPVTVEAVAPTCTEPGRTAGSVCSRCGAVLEGFEEIPAAGHAYGAPEWTWNEELTAASAKFVCANCGDVQNLNAEITEEVVTEAAPHIAGEKKLTAKVTMEGAEYTDEMIVFTEALPCPCAAFEDMPPYGTPEHEAIDWAFTHDPQITSGMNETTFGYGQTLTRAQASTFLYAAAGRPEFDETAAENPFSDVKSGKWYTKPVLWAYSQGLVSGMSANTYGINSNLTRGQIMVILYAWAGKPSVEGLENPYTDVAAGKWYTNSAIWAYHAGIEQGANGKYVQSTPCTREAMVLYLYRYLTGSQLLPVD